MEKDQMSDLAKAILEHKPSSELLNITPIQQPQGARVASEGTQFSPDILGSRAIKYSHNQQNDDTQ